MKCHFLVSIILLLSFSTTNAQWYDPEKVNKRAAEIYSDALENARDEKYANAIKLMADALKTDPKLVDAYLSLGGIYANMKNYDESVSNYEKGFAMDAIYSRDYYLPYSISLAGAGQFQKAVDAVNKFLESP